MKLYKDTTKRIAKKKLGWRWKKILFGLTLKPGDIISTCKGYNERITEMYPEWSSWGLSKGKYIVDFSITTESGSGCSLVHCLTTPTETKEQIIEYWKWYNTEEGIEFLKRQEKYGYNFKNPIPQALAEDKEVFDDEGQPLYEYATEYERKARFK